MKSKNFFVKIVALVFCAVFSFLCLFSCKQIDEINGKIDDVNTELSNKVDKETYDTLNTFVNEIDAIAKAAVSTEKFDSALAELNASVAAKADAAKVAADIAAVKSALEEMITANATADAATKTALDAALVKITSLEGTVATQAALEAAVESINATAAANKQALEAKIAAVEALITKADSDITDVSAALAELSTTVESNKKSASKAVADAKAELEGKISEANEVIDDLASVVEANNATLTSQVETINAAIEELKKADADNKAAIEKKIADEIAAVKKTVSENDKKVNDKISALETKVSGLEATLNSKVTEINNTVNTKISALKDELNGKISELQTSYNAFVETTNTEISSIKALIETIETQIETLHSNSDSFAEKYQAATDELYNGEYSIDNFNAKVATILSEDYEESKYKDFEEAVERLRFFLNRAITVDAIKGYFGELDAIIEAMPTLVESLTEMLTAYTENAPEGERKYLTADADELNSIKTVYEKIGTVEEELKALYDSIVAAHTNLVDAAAAAEDVKNNINNIAAPIVYTDSEPAIVYAENAFTVYSEAYFADAEMTKYYGNTDAAALVTNYGKLEEYRARYEVLESAADHKVVFADVVLNYNTDRPLWKELAAIEEEVAEYDAWLLEYEINETLDAATIANIYAGELELLDKALAYATYMNGVYTDKDVEALVAEISEYVANTEVLYNTKDTCDAFNAAREDVKTAIEAATDYAADDKNYVEMFTQELIDKLAGVTARMEELVEAKAAIDAVDEEMKALLGNVTINTYETIKSYRTALDQLYVDYEIVVNDDNYVSLASAAEADYTALIAEYNEATAVVAEAYVSVRTRLDTVEWLLKDGHEIPGLVADLKDLIRQGVTNVNLIFESGDIQVDIPKLFDDYLDAASEYKANATTVADAADSVNTAIEALNGKVFTDVKLNAEILTVYNAFVAWTEAYLADDIAVANGDVRVAIAAIQDITIYGSNPEATYAFVTLENYDLLIEAYNTAVASYEEAENAWSDIKADMEALHADSDIHSYEESELNFVAVNDAYDEYVETYYNGSIEESTQQFGELTTVSDFNTDMGNWYIALNNAQAAADGINDIIDNLGDITMSNADDVLLEIAVIESLIADYQTAYCDGQCNITEARFFALRKARAVAEVSSAYNIVYNAAAAEDQAKLEEAYLVFVDDGMGNSVNDVELNQFRDIAESKIV